MKFAKGFRAKKSIFAAYADDLPRRFYDDFIYDCLYLLDTHPLNVAKPLFNESGLKSWALNPNGHAAGIFQAMPFILDLLGYKDGWDDFIKLTADEQLPWLVKYFSRYKGHLDNPTAVYMATFTPAFIIHGGEPQWCIARSRATIDAAGGKERYKGEAAIYAANPSFDHTKKGWIEVNDLTVSIDLATKGPRWEEIKDTILSLMKEGNYENVPATPEVDVTDNGQNNPIYANPDEPREVLSTDAYPYARKPFFGYAKEMGMTEEKKAATYDVGVSATSRGEVQASFSVHFGKEGRMPIRQIAFLNKSEGDLTDVDCQLIARACAVQLDRDLCPAWGFMPWECAFYPDISAVPAGAILHYFLRDPGSAGYLGFHDVDPHGNAYIKTFTKPSGGIKFKGANAISVTASHECCETAVDPDAAQWVVMPDGLTLPNGRVTRSTLIARESADICEADAYDIELSQTDGSQPCQSVTVSNFILPAYFYQNAPGPYDFMGLVDRAFGMRPGGYGIFMQNGEVFQAFAKTAGPKLGRMEDPTLKEFDAARTQRRMRFAAALTPKGITPSSFPPKMYEKAPEE